MYVGAACHPAVPTMANEAMPVVSMTALYIPIPSSINAKCCTQFKPSVTMFNTYTTSSIFLESCYGRRPNPMATPVPLYGVASGSNTV